MQTKDAIILDACCDPIWPKLYRNVEGMSDHDIVAKVVEQHKHPSAIDIADTTIEELEPGRWYASWQGEPLWYVTLES